MDVYHIIALGLIRGLWFLIHWEAEELVAGLEFISDPEAA